MKLQRTWASAELETDKENVPCRKGRRAKKLEIKKEPVSACDETVNLLKAFNSYMAQKKGAVSQEMPGATLREVRRELGRRWKLLTVEEKTSYRPVKD